MSSRFCIISTRGSCTPQKATYLVQSQSTDATRLATEGRVATPGPGCPTSMPTKMPLSSTAFLRRGHVPITIEPGGIIDLSPASFEFTPPSFALILQQLLIYSTQRERKTQLECDVVEVLILHCLPLAASLSNKFGTCYPSSRDDYPLCTGWELRAQHHPSV